MVLNDTQKQLAADYIDIVKWAVYRHIRVSENRYGLGYDDLYQEGCIWLCHAAATYDGSRAQFDTYAQVVVRNGLISYCRAIYAKQKNMVTMSGFCSDSDDTANDTADNIADNIYDKLLSDAAVFGLLESVKPQYKGVTLLGIEALELKIKGYTGAEIARLWGVEQNHVGAWITRAVKKLRQNEKFITELQA